MCVLSGSGLVRCAIIHAWRERQDKGWKHSGVELANYGADARIVH
jgi:hypothetical protein